MSSAGRFDIAPFALPACAPGEVRFEEPRDIVRVEAAFRGHVPARVGLSYLAKTWPRVRLELQPDLENPGIFGWNPIDDWFNCKWKKAAARARKTGRALTLTFAGLGAEYGKEAQGYDVLFRRTLGVRIDGVPPDRIAGVAVFTASLPVSSAIRIELDAGRKTPVRRLSLTGYNARVSKLRPVRGRGGRVFSARIGHMSPAHRYAHDDGHVTFDLGNDAFTISVEDLKREGAIWYAEAGVFVTPAESGMDFASYRERTRGKKTVSRRVRERPEHTYRQARGGQPKAHPVNFNFGCKHARQRFWQEWNGDLVLHRNAIVHNPRDADSGPLKGADSARFLSSGHARLFFGFENWRCTARFPDPPPASIYNLAWEKDGLVAEQKTLCVPLTRPILKGEPAGDETTVALVRFRFRNTGSATSTARLPIRYTQEAWRPGGWFDAYLVPQTKLDKLLVRGPRVASSFKGRKVLRFTAEGGMRLAPARDGISLERELAPGESCEAVLKVPYIALESAKELAALRSLSFEKCRRDVRAFWEAENASGSQLACPEPPFGELYASHLTHVQITDFAMPNAPEMINTSVGTSTYGNFSNESCMIVQELDQRGFHEDAERRIETWIRFQGTAPQPGNFTDYDGMFFGAGGFECGDYNQHHGWVLWIIAEHYRLTRDKTWLARVAPHLIKGADWVFRQRRNTLGSLPHSRGWERGFLPAGSLEDVTDFHYWLSTNSLTWRGCDSSAEVLEEIGHPESARIRREADEYGADLRRGFETMRRHSPLVKLDDGRWVPTYPSRMYCRGRDTGWIREVLEGSVYLLISGLYDPKSQEAGWILDDYQDNRYLKPPYGYPLVYPEVNVFARGGFSIQPNLLAGLMPHLDRDEPEVFIWMFLNAWASCYREEINAMCEHPLPELGYSNAAQFKTSDEANAIMWLRYMYVYWNRDLLHLGRALPKAWLEDEREAGITKVSTYFGEVGARYVSEAGKGRIGLDADLKLDRPPARILARFRHPQGKKLKSVKVNGKRGRIADRIKGDVDLTGLKGKVTVTASY